MELNKLVCDAGILGAGGAGFPTHVKINCKAEIVLANGAECEPYLTSDYRLMLEEPEKIINVNDVLDELIQQSVALVGKPAALMNKDDKVRAIRFLSDAGAFLVTKSGDKVAKYFGISKYTLYSYIDANKQQEEKKHG